jgi:AraC-like DNA-binding protein
MYPILSNTELLNQITVLFVHRVKYCEMHRHEALEILWVLKGAIQVKVNETHHLLHRGDLLFINRLDHHQVQAVSDDNLVLCLQHRFVQPFPVLVINEESNPVRRSRQNELRSLLAHMWWEKYYKADYWQLAFEQNLLALQLELCRYFIQPATHSTTLDVGDDKRIRNILSFLQHSYQQPITLPRLAKQFALTESYLSHYFKAKTGSTLLRYLSQIRLEACLNDLLQTKLTISDIALASGFPSIKAFNTAFRREYQLTPSEFRDRQSQ